MNIEQGDFAQGGCGAAAEGSAEGGRDDPGALSGAGWHQEVEHFPFRKWAL